MKILNNDRGDTIIEVLFAIVVIALTLTGAYLSADNSLTNVRIAQEREQALYLAQAQIEDLRADASDVVSPYAPVSGTGPAFCFANNAGAVTLYAANLSNCQVAINSTRYYTISDTATVKTITVPTAGAFTTDSFTITVNWIGQGSAATGTQQLVLYYRIQP